MSHKHTHVLYAHFDTGNDDEVNDFPIIADYYVWGGYKGSLHSPPEHPDVEIECFRINKSLAKFLGCNEVVSLEKIEKLFGPKELERMWDEIVERAMDEVMADDYDYDPDPDDAYDRYYDR